MDRILVVDDDVLILQALTRILENEGYAVVPHSQPEHAAREEDVAVILTDYMMPGMNGVELLDALRPRNPHAVRMLLTAAADFKVASKAINQGQVYRLLGKPWTMAELTQSVRQAVEHHHLLVTNERLTREVEAKNAELLGLNRGLERKVVERTNGLLDGLVSALDYRDTETQWHSRRVSLYTRRLARELGVAGAELDVIEQGALLHDIGKIGVRDSILLKPGPLTAEEWVEMRMHPEFGFRMLANIPYLYEASLIVLQHQERWDGKGYPAGLAGEAIVLGARAFSVADTLDAITSDRPYRKGQPLAVARAEIARCAGTQFDPAVCAAFARVPDAEWMRIRAEVEAMAVEAMAVEGAAQAAPRPPAPEALRLAR
jgi:putative nucleotidyltransferase with HDIG domain